MGAQPRWTAPARGFSLVELMVAMVISLLVMLGLVSVMDNVGVVNRAQDGLARLQENGRYAMTRVSQDLRAAAAQHCSSFGVGSSQLGAGGFTYLDRGRAAFAKFYVGGTGAGLVDASGAPFRFGPTFGPTGGYFVSPIFMMLGSECDDNSCDPLTDEAQRGGLFTALPAMGTTAGLRTRGGDVLTLRYLDGDGVRIVGQRNFLQDGVAVQFDLDPATAATLDLAGGRDAVWFTDCSISEIARATQAGSVLTLANNFAATLDNDIMRRMDTRSDARAFNLTRDLRVVSYYLQLKNDPNNAARRISSLMRRDVSANPAVQELVEGVERLDFLYGVDDALGRTRYLTAEEVDDMAAADCPPWPTGLTAVEANGCGWRAVKNVEVFMLLNTVGDVAVTGDEEFRYSFLNDGNPNAAATYEVPSALGTLRNGLPPGRMLRREFRALVSLRDYNY
jgi:type IV pilus assembly protein PilW